MQVTAYYNENDRYAAQWLRNLIKAGHIAPGYVDERSIADVKADDLLGFTQCHFFAGIGVWSYALRIAGWSDDKPVWTGSCPCQPFSVIGNGTGFADERHLWPVWLRLIAKRKPTVVFGEQVEAAIKHGWFDLVQSDLEAIGYAFGMVGLPAAGVGAPHGRHRVFFVGDASGKGLEGYNRNGGNGCKPGWNKTQTTGSIAKAGNIGNDEPFDSFWRTADWLWCKDGKCRPVEPGTFPLVNGTPARVGRLRAYGNAIVPQVAQEFIKAYMDYENLPNL